jgi:hypothetical protein
MASNTEINVQESDIDWKAYDIRKAREIAKRFGSAVLLDMAHNIQKLDLVDRGIFLKSLKSSPKQNIKGFISHIEFRYEWYGKFFELGAENVFGKGIEIKSTPWRKPAIEKNINELNAEMAEYYAEIILKNITISSTSTARKETEAVQKTEKIKLTH